MTKEIPNQLLKYAGADAGLKILKNQALYWSSPNDYRSPDEMNGHYELPFANNELLDSAVKLATSLIFNPERPSGDTPLMSAILRWRDEERFSTPQQAQVVLRDLLSKMVEQKQEQLSSSLQKWQLFCESIRCCCFSHTLESLKPWEKYAEHHTGLAIALRTDADHDLVQAQAVSYSTERPQLTTLKEQMAQLLHNAPININQRFAKSLLQKSTHNSDEQEWRVLIPRNETFKKADAHADTKNLAPGTIKAVYLGVRCGAETIAEVIATAKTLQPSPKIYQMQLNKQSYKLESIPYAPEHSAIKPNTSPAMDNQTTLPSTH